MASTEKKEKYIGKSRRSNVICDTEFLNNRPKEGFVTKRYRRKVRLTEDFNYLNRSSLSFDSNVYKVGSDSASKKTKKQNVMNFLPEVVWPVKENLTNMEIKSKQKSRRNNSTIKTNEDPQFESNSEPTSENTSDGEITNRRKLRRRKAKLVEINCIEGHSKGITSSAVKQIVRNKHLGKNMKEDKNNTFTESSSGNLSEDLIEKINPHNLEDNQNDPIQKTLINSNKEVVQGNYSRNNKESNQNNSYSKIVSELPREEIEEKRKRHIKRTKRISVNSDQLNNFDDSDQEFKVRKCNKKVKNVGSRYNLPKNVNVRISESLNNSKQNEIPPKTNIINIEKNQSSDFDDITDQVLNRTFEVLEPVNKIDSPNIAQRKSVRFLSPVGDYSKVNKSTTLFNNLMDMSLSKSPHNYSKSEKKQFRKSTPHVKKSKLSVVDRESMGKENLKYSTEESQESDDEVHINISDTSSTLSSKLNNKKNVKISENIQLVKNKSITPKKTSQGLKIFENMSPDISENEKSIILQSSNSKSTTKSILRSTTSFTIDTDHNISKSALKNCNTLDLPSPIHYRTTRSLRTPADLKKQSVIDLITPTPEKENTVFDFPFSNSINVDRYSIKENIDLIETNNTNENKYNVTENFKTSDTHFEEISKVKTRKRWNKSLGVSFLDNTGNIQNILPPLSDETFPELVINSDESHLNVNLSAKTPKQEINSIKKTIAPCSSSTPIVRNRNMPERKKNTSNTNNSSVTINKSITRTKMPNFALIHQRAYDKMENLKEMSERKAARAKQLLSGHKPNVDTSLKSPSKSRKILKYSPKLAKRRGIPTLKSSTSKNQNIVVNATTKRNIVPSTSNPKITNLPKIILKKGELPNMKSCIPKPILKKVDENKKNFTKMGFKVNSEVTKKPSKEDQKKAITTKSKIMNSSVDSRRNVVQNIRTNRRFELLMKMRNKK